MIRDASASTTCDIAWLHSWCERRPISRPYRIYFVTRTQRRRYNCTHTAIRMIGSKRKERPCLQSLGGQLVLPLTDHG